MLLAGTAPVTALLPSFARADVGSGIGAVGRPGPVWPCTRRTHLAAAATYSSAPSSLQCPAQNAATAPFSGRPIERRCDTPSSTRARRGTSSKPSRRSRGISRTAGEGLQGGS